MPRLALAVENAQPDETDELFARCRRGSLIERHVLEYGDYHREGETFAIVYEKRKHEGMLVIAPLDGEMLLNLVRGVPIKFRRVLVGMEIIKKVFHVLSEPRDEYDQIGYHSVTAVDGTQDIRPLNLNQQTRFDRALWSLRQR